MQKNLLYRVTFTQEDKIYELYANFISEESLMGFIALDELIFLPDDEMEKEEDSLKHEFHHVKRCYVPLHHILRIDEVDKEGVAKIKILEHKDNVRSFPGAYLKHDKK